MSEKISACVRFYRRLSSALEFTSHIALILLAIVVLIFMHRARQEVRAMHTEVVQELRAVRINQDTIVSRILRQREQPEREP